MKRSGVVLQLRRLQLARLIGQQSMGAVLPTFCRNHVGEVGCITSHTVNLLRRDRVEKLQAQEIEPGLGLHDATVMSRLLWAEYGEIDPRKARMESCAPDDVGDIEDAAVFELGLSVLGSGEPGDAFHACFCQVFRLHSKQWLTA